MAKHSAEALAYHRLYRTARWRQLRQQILVKFNYTCQLCRKLCLEKGTAHVDHREPHKGNLELFWAESNLTVLCLRCHSGPKQSEEKRGYSSMIDASGWPVDPRHPANRTR